MIKRNKLFPLWKQLKKTPPVATEREKENS
nr:MAG TPA: hypothetical protein [Caudoviricetes sp.]